MSETNITEISGFYEGTKFENSTNGNGTHIKKSGERGETFNDFILYKNNSTINKKQSYELYCIKNEQNSYKIKTDNNGNNLNIIADKDFSLEKFKKNYNKNQDTYKFDIEIISIE